MRIWISIGLISFVFGYVVSKLKSRMVREIAPPLIIPDETAFNNRSHLYYIAVLPEYRGSGIANDLISCFVEASRNMDFKSTMLCVSKSNERAIAFYKKNGYKLFTELGENDIIMYIDFRDK